MSASATSESGIAAWPVVLLARSALLLAGLALAVWYNASLTLNPDVSWFYYVARRLLGGAVLYRDLIDPNAPFASLSMIPAAWLGQATGWSAFHAILAYVAALGALSFLVSARIIDRYGLPLARADGLKLLLFLAIFFLPVSLFGEREHLFCILAAPYVLTVPMRGIDARTGRALRFAIGLVAGIAANIKPPFALVLAAVEAASLLVAGRGALLWSEQIGLAASAALTLPVYPLVFPLYASSVVPWVVDLYGAFADTATTLRKTAEWGVLALLLGVAWRRDGNPALDRLRYIMPAAITAALAIFVLQDKGWDYQCFIASFFIAILAGLVLQAPAVRPRLRMLAGLVAFLLVVRAGAQFEAPDYVESHFPTIKRLISQTPGRFQVLTSAGTPGFPFTVETGHDWASRYGCLMLLPGIVAAEARGGHSRWEAPFRQAVAEDMATLKPSLIFVQTEQLPGLPLHFNVLAWLLRDPRFAAQWAQYRAEGIADRYFVVYRRMS
jgi:hypothetical protein